MSDSDFPERDYLERTIATVRNHRDAENCWPSWANIFANEIERCWALIEERTRQRDERLKKESGIALIEDAQRWQRNYEKVIAALDEAREKYADLASPSTPLDDREEAWIRLGAALAWRVPEGET